MKTKNDSTFEHAKQELAQAQMALGSYRDGVAKKMQAVNKWTNKLLESGRFNIEFTDKE